MIKQRMNEMKHTYKGKYPYNINSVSSTKNKGEVIVKTNNGDKYLMTAKNLNGKYPDLGKSVFDYNGWQKI